MKIADLSSLLEIMFAVNAVFPFVLSQYIKNRDVVIAHVYQKARNHKIDLSSIEKKYMKEAAYASFANFRFLNRIFLYIGITASVLGTLIAIVLLLWSAENPEASLSSAIAYILIVVFVIIAPLFYLSFSILSNQVVNRLKNKNGLESEMEAEVEAVKILAEIMKTNDETKKVLVDIQVDLWKIELKSLQQQIKNYPGFFLRMINPIYWYNEMRIKRIIKKYEKRDEL